MTASQNGARKILRALDWSRKQAMAVIDRLAGYLKAVVTELANTFLRGGLVLKLAAAGALLGSAGTSVAIYNRITDDPTPILPVARPISPFPPVIPASYIPTCLADNGLWRPVNNQSECIPEEESISAWTGLVAPPDLRAWRAPLDFRATSDLRAPWAPPDFRAWRAPLDFRAPRAPPDPRAPRAPPDPRAWRAPLDLRATSDLRDPWAPPDLRVWQAPLEPAVQRAHPDLRAPRANSAPQDRRAPEVTTDPRVAPALLDPKVPSDSPAFQAPLA